MADFKTHSWAAVLASGTAVVAADTVGRFGWFNTSVMLLLGVTGGMAPDIDSPRSWPARLTSSFLIVLLLVGLAVQKQGEPFADLLVLGVVLFAAAQLALPLLSPYLRHRGLVHSIPMAFLAGIVVILTSVHVFHAPPVVGWWFGAFFSGGFLLHLTLDECYSVDFKGRRLKRSFGTALSLGSRKRLLPTLTLYLLLVASWQFLPPPPLPIDTFIATINALR